MAKPTKVFHRSLMAMGTRLDLVLPFVDDKQGTILFEKIRAEVNRLELKLSYFNPSSSLSVINKEAFLNPIEADNELYAILKECARFYDLTKGYFDITVRPLMNLMMQGGKDVAPDKIQALKAHLGMDKIILDDEKKTVRFDNNYLSLDLGGYAKGYAIDNVRNILLDESITSALLSFGNSSIAVIGEHPHGKYWGIGIENPFTHANTYTFKARDMSVSTSGITAGNLKKHHGLPHIINPRTQEPTAINKTIAVMTKTGTVAEVASTALMVCQKNERSDIIKSLEVIDGVEIQYTDKSKVSLNSLINQ